MFWPLTVTALPHGRVPAEGSERAARIERGGARHDPSRRRTETGPACGSRRRVEAWPTSLRTSSRRSRANGIDRVYGLPGDSLNGFTDALRKDGTIRWVHVRHEESAAFAAAARGRDSPASSPSCAGRCGPGNLHLINGLYDANRSRVPVLAIAAHIPTTEIGTGYFQETHPQELFRECSVYVEYVADPAQMPRLLEIAMRAAIEKRGVAVLVIPGDVALAEIADDRAVVIERTRPGRRAQRVPSSSARRRC